MHAPLLHGYGTAYGSDDRANGNRFSDLVERYKDVSREKYLEKKGALDDKNLEEKYQKEAEFLATRDANRPQVLDVLRKFLREQAEITDGEIAALWREFSEVPPKLNEFGDPLNDMNSEDFSWDVPDRTSRAQYIRHRGTTIKSEHRVPMSIDEGDKIQLRTQCYTYLGFVFAMVVFRTLYHFHQSDALLWSCVVMYIGILYFGLQTMITPKFNNMDPKLLRDFARNTNIIVVFAFSIIYLIQVGIYAYNPLLNDTTDQTFQFSTALIEILVLFHGLLLDVLYYVPYPVRSALLINNFCVIICMSTVMYLDDSERPYIIRPEFRFIDLYTGTLTAIMVMYAGMLFNHFIRRDGRTAILTRHYILFEDESGESSFSMWIPLLFVIFYSGLTAVPSLSEDVTLRICIIIIHPFLIYFFIFRGNLDFAYLPAPFDRVDMCSMALVPIIHIVLGFCSRSEGLAFALDHIIESMNVYCWLCIDLIAQKSDLWVFSVTFLAFGYITFEVTATLFFWDQHDAMILAQIGDYKLARGHIERSLFLAFWILAFRAFGIAFRNVIRPGTYMIFVRERIKKAPVIKSGPNHP